MLRVTELVKPGNNGPYTEKTTFLNKSAIISVTEDVPTSKALTEQKGQTVVVSKIRINLPEGTRTIIALGGPDSIMGNPRSTGGGLLYG